MLEPAELPQPAAGPGRARAGAGPAPGLELQRHLWFRFVVTAACVGAGVSVRRVVDVLVDAGSQTARPGPWGPTAVLFPVPGAMGWIGAYELKRLAPAALEQARAMAVEVLAAEEARQAPALACERAFVQAHFAARRQELLMDALRRVRRAQAACAYRCIATGSEPAKVLEDRARRLAAEARLRQEEAIRALTALDAEEQRALQELAGRFRASARIEPVGLGVVWRPCALPE